MHIAYIPNNLDLDQLIKQHPTTGIGAFSKDKVYYVCHSIYSQMHLLNDNGFHQEKDGEGFVPLASKILRKIIGSNYKTIMKWMGNAGIIRCDNSYREGVVSMGYQFTDTYQLQESRCISIYLRNYERFRRTDPYNRDNPKISPGVVKYLNSMFNKDHLKINKEWALQIINSEYEQALIAIELTRGAKRKLRKRRIAFNKLNTNSIAVDNLINGYYNTNIDNYGYRFHTPITRLMKILRPTLLYNNKSLGQIDISNSLLYFTIYLMDWRNYPRGSQEKMRGKKFKKEIWDGIIGYKNRSTISNTIMWLKSLETRYGKGLQNHLFYENCRNGRIYEDILETLDPEGYFSVDWEYTQKRKYVKKILLQQLFASPTRHKRLYKGKAGKIWEYFKLQYPEIEYLYSKLKETDHRNISRLLQRIESVAMLGHVCKYLKKEYPLIPIFTIHDCLATTTDHLGLVEGIMSSQIASFVGCPPNFSREHWSTENSGSQVVRNVA